MNKKLFAKKEMQNLSKNPYVTLFWVKSFSNKTGGVVFTLKESVDADASVAKVVVKSNGAVNAKIFFSS